MLCVQALVQKFEMICNEFNMQVKRRHIQVQNLSKSGSKILKLLVINMCK
jgi:hypothetical protein